MEQFRIYVNELDRIFLRATSGRPEEGLPSEIEESLNGQAFRELRRLVPLHALRESGAFFTSEGLAARAAARIRGSVDHRSVICDPACGAGDLLLAGARCLPVGATYAETVSGWTRQLSGRDLHGSFVDAARRRLSLLALSRMPAGGADPAGVPDAFGGITAGCGITGGHPVAAATHVLMNPPFGQVTAPEVCGWGSGLVSEAALFVEACVLQARPGTRVVAILPDVLRSGGRYGRWREAVTRRSRLVWLDLAGQFDPQTDVDVFLAELIVTDGSGSAAARAPWLSPAGGGAGSIADHFAVSVGSVVAYRDVQSGPRVRYIQARGLPAWAVMPEVEGRRQYRGRLHAPPFVAIRRTSRVGDRHRAVATVVCGAAPVAVENHLVVLTPVEGGLATCLRAMTVLQTPETDEWLDQRIRCRHLTLDSVRGIPFHL